MLAEVKTKRQPKPPFNTDGRPPRSRARQPRRPSPGQDYREGRAPDGGLDGENLKRATTTHEEVFANFTAHRQAATPANFLQRIATWRRRMKERRQLATLGHRELGDFMCSSADASAETDKWFWQA